MWPEAAAVSSSLGRVLRRLQIASIAHATLLAASVAGIVVMAMASFDVNDAMAWSVSAIAFVVSGGAAAGWQWRRLTLRHAAAVVESRRAQPDNTVVTVEEVLAGRARHPHAILRAGLLAAALRGLDEAPPRAVQPLGRLVTLAAASVIAVAGLQLSLPQIRRELRRVDGPRAADFAVAIASSELRVVITPPAYTGLKPALSINPLSVLALEGSRVRLEAARTSGPLTLIDVTSGATPFAADANTLYTEFVATTSRPLVIRRLDANSADRLVTLRVETDERPVVRIQQPAKDLMFPEPRGQVPIEIDARDDLGLRGLTLRYTRVSGSGETFTFQEAEWPVEITRTNAGHWTARTSLELQQLELQDGDTVVYRAVATDAKPGADPATSDTFLIEVGRLAGIAATGFALPADRDRHAISQQMLIIKTERLHADRHTLAPAALLEQSRLLAIEQRMVKAEFVFMTGGEVADEIEEAAAGHELVEGRFENTAQVELLTAIREMSRAEARLNDANTSEALQFERAALAALQRAFDRRRYLLRTLPERARIDQSRRLTGEIANAKSSNDAHAAITQDPLIDRVREVLRDLRAMAGNGADVSVLASRLIAIDPQSEELQKAAGQLAGARESTAQRGAAREAEGVLIEVLKARLPIATPTGIVREPLLGRVAEQFRRSPR